MLDSELNKSWGVKRIGAGKVHGYNQGDGVKVAVLDTDIDYRHTDLDANYAGGYDFVNYDADPFDDHGHGTLVTGVIAAEDNAAGVWGVPASRAVRVESHRCRRLWLRKRRYRRSPVVRE